MNIKYMPQDRNHPADRKAGTNIGEFSPGEVRALAEQDMRQAQTLVDNGDFVWTEEAPNHGNVPMWAPAAEEPKPADEPKKKEKK